MFFPKIFSNKLFILILKLIISAGLLYFLIHNTQIDLQLILKIFSQPSTFIEVVFLFFVTIFLAAKRWHLLNFAQGIHLGLWRTILPTYLGTAFNTLLPGAVGGDFVRCYYLFKKIPDKKNSALISVFLDRFIGLIGIITIVCLMALLNFHFFYKHSELFYLLLIYVAFCAGSFIILALLMILTQKIGLEQKLINRFSNKTWIHSLTSFLETLKNYRVSPKVLLECIGLSVLLQLLAAETVLLIAKTMGFPIISVRDYAIAFGVAQIVNLIPITPGGIGFGEIAFANVLVMLNPTANAPFATIFLTYRFLSWLLYLPGVLYTIPRVLSLKKLPFKIRKRQPIEG